MLAALLSMNWQAADDGSLDGEDAEYSELDGLTDKMDEALNHAGGYVCSGPGPQRSQYLRLSDEFEMLSERASVVLDRFVQTEIRTRSCENFHAGRFSRAIRQAEFWKRRLEAELKRAESR